MGFLLIALGIMAVSDEGVANLGATGLAGITTDVLGETWGKLFLVDVALAIFVCCLAIHAMSVRILFAMGRDNALPVRQAACERVGHRRVPIVPALTTGAMPSSSWPQLGNPRAFTIIISLGIILVYIAYLMVTAQPCCGAAAKAGRATSPTPGTACSASAAVGQAHERGRNPLRRGHDHQPEWPREELLRPALISEMRASGRRSRCILFALGLAIYYGGQKGQGRGARGAPGRAPTPVAGADRVVTDGGAAAR